MRYLLSVLGVCIGVFLCLNVNFRKNYKNKSYISLVNIEALANEGEDDEVKIVCYYKGSLDCPTSPEKVKLIYTY